MACSIDGCGKPVRARGWCSAHWKRWRAHGDPLKGRTPRGVAHRWMVEVALAYDGDECLIWPFRRNDHGYGVIDQGGTPRRVHRIICQQRHGPPPTPEHEAAHNCGKGHEGCVAGRHLRWATHAENCADTISHGTSLAGERNSSAKLTEAQILAIRADGRCHSAIAADYGVARRTISSVKTGKAWGHVPRVTRALAIETDDGRVLVALRERVQPEGMQG